MSTITFSKQISAPKYFKANSIIKFINDCAPIFKLVDKKEKEFLLDLSKITECSMVGVLLVYKIVEFSILQNCFDRPGYLMTKPFNDALEKYGFSELFISYLAQRETTEKQFINLKISVSDNFIIAPQALLRNDKFSSAILNTNYLPKIQKYYSFNEKITSMIFMCFSEILLNFWEHAVDDTQSIIVANGNKHNIEIACADNGKGVLTTLKSAGKKRKDDITTLMSAVEKGVTSKSMSNHMGYGLWIIDEVARLTNGRFHLYSEGTYYQREFGKVRSGKCGYWQGTVVYLSLPLKNPITLSDFESSEKKDNNNIQINWL